MSVRTTIEVDVVTSSDFLKQLRDETKGAAVFGGLDIRTNFAPWSLTTAEWPLARVECSCQEDIISAVRVASRCGIPFTVCGGREDLWGRNSRSGAMSIDLSQMRRIHFDEQNQFVEIESGVTTGLLLDTLPEDIVLPTTVNRNVGLIGATLGGGYGMLCGSYGLTCDALLSAELVVPTGEVLRASAEEHSDLLYALKGGGSGYGVVVSARYRTYVCPGVLTAKVLVRIDSALGALLSAQELLDIYPVELGILPLFINMEDDGPMLVLNFVWNGREQDGRKVLERLRGLESAVVDSAAFVPFRATLDNGSIWPWGKYWEFETRNFSRLTPELSHELVETARRMPMPGNVLFLHDFHGHATGQSSSDAAFPLRQNHFVACACASWSESDSEEMKAKQQDWIASAKTRFEPLALPGGYINFLPPEDGERLSQTFGNAAAELEALKRHCDPQDLLQYATGRL